uniref:FlgD/Vpr Ig-like domain-containing protein n=1 Tax=Eiseniibacteriota bacterium TaxID=2212470 RepID=A0A832I4X6_UNCEI
MKHPRVPVVRLALVVAGALAITSLAHARPSIRASFFAKYPSAVGSRLDNLNSNDAHCGVCHFDFNGAGPKNGYGNRIAALLGSYPNTDAGRQQLMTFIGPEDSDGDGHSNDAEITDLVNFTNTPTFPGLTSGNLGSCLNVSAAEISGHLTPAAGVDNQPPLVNVTSPNGGENWTGGSARTVTWTATDNVGVLTVDIQFRASSTEPWLGLAVNHPNTGAFTWFVHNMPSSTASVRVLARDAMGNVGRDSSDAGFTIAAQPGGIAPTTLRDFDQPGSQPLEATAFDDRYACMACHGGYDASVEPGHNFQGSMMGHSARDPLFYACMTIAEQDAPGAGDLCIRCHAPMGWMLGHSQPTSGARLDAFDRDGLSCDVCHRMVDPVYKPGVSPPEDQAVLAGLLPGHTPTGYSNGQYVLDANQRKRGPFTDPAAPHPFLVSDFHKRSEFCGTCHDVSNPAFVRSGVGQPYLVGALDQPADSISSLVLMPLERTYSEWKNSAYPAGVFQPEFAGNKPDGIVSTCQDCHMRDVAGSGCNDPLAPLRPDLPLHDMTGGSSWMPGVVASLYPGEVDAQALADGAARAVAMLQKAATLDVAVSAEGDSFRAEVTVTNRTGHKLPTGYPEGRRMWLHVVAKDAFGGVVYESGAYDAGTGHLEENGAVIYEAHLGITPALGGALGLGHGPSFHFALNDSIYKDNRIPPQGFTNAAFAAFGGEPKDPQWSGPGPRYPDGQHHDVAVYRLPAAARSVVARLYYQSTSREYVEFLRDENTTDNRGQVMYDAWVAHGRAAPVAMVADSATFGPVAVGPADPAGAALRTLSNPFTGGLELRLGLAAPAPVTLEVFDVRGARVAREPLGTMAPGEHALRWNGRDSNGRDAGAGVYWVRVTAGEIAFTRRVVRLR